jgi:hypothetical protein
LLPWFCDALALLREGLEIQYFLLRTKQGEFERGFFNMQLRVKADRKIIYVSILAAALVRSIDAVTDALYFTKGSFPAAFPQVVFHELFDASIVFAIVLGCGILVSRTIAERQAAECELRRANDELEKRSTELQRSNEQLEAK